MLSDNIMPGWTHPLDLAASARRRLAWAAGLLGLMWAAIAWALTA
jgi:hypothetical protein